MYVAAAVELKDGFPERSAVLLGAALRWTDHMDYQDEMLPELAERGAEMALDNVARLLEGRSTLRSQSAPTPQSTFTIW